VRSPADITDAVSRRLTRTWHLDVAEADTNWPYAVTIGTATAAELTADFTAVQRRVHALRTWADQNGLAVKDGNRRVHGTTQPIPTHVTVIDVDTAAKLAGPEWVARIQRGRNRATLLADRYPKCENIAKVIRAADGYSDIDFDLLLSVTDWFKTNDAEGLTPRQVPVPGVHAKWLNRGRPVVELLAGKSLNLAAPHPARIHFMYLDPDHLAAGGRRFDSATVGDAVPIAYKPDIVIITENKDTAINFPVTKGAIAVEGDGYGGAAVAQFDWIVNAPLVVYWGDIDAEGFEILDGYRKDGIPVTSILMDPDTYRTYAAWGTHLDKRGQMIGKREPKALVNLTKQERATYLSVCSPPDGLPPRLEQERIPLGVPHAAISFLVARSL
jgi:hypothetical protein